MKIQRSVFFLLLILISELSLSLEQSQVQAWEEDIEYYAKQIRARHIDPFHKLREEDFNANLQRFVNGLPSMNEQSVWIALMVLTEKFGDGHTSFPIWEAELSRYPIAFEYINDGYYVVSTDKANQFLLGSKLAAINDLSVKMLQIGFSSIVPFSENSYSQRQQTAQYLNKAEVLFGLGYVSKTEDVEFEFYKENEFYNKTFSPSNEIQFEHSLSYKNNSVFEKQEIVSSALWFASSKTKNTVYIHFHRYESMSDMESFSEDLLKFVDENKVSNVIIDLRGNYGGDFFAGLKLAQALVLADSIDWKEGVYTLIDNGTFSAAMSNAVQFKQILNAHLVGLPTGAKPKGYQDMGQFRLPNSGFTVTYSKRLYRFMETDKDAVYPDTRIERSIDDYMAKNDRQLNWIIERLKNSKSL